MTDVLLLGAGKIGRMIATLLTRTGDYRLRIGDELLVYIPAKRLDNERPDIIPSQSVGVVRVVKVSDHSATVRVTGARNTGFRNGLPARLVRRAP